MAKVDEEKLNAQATVEVEEKLQAAVADQEAKLQNAKENLVYSLRNLKVKFSTVQGFIEANNIYYQLTEGRVKMDSSVGFADVLSTQSIGIKMLNQIIEDIPSWNLLDYSAYLSGYIDEDFNKVLKDNLNNLNDADIVIEAANEVMRQTICRAVDPTISDMVEFFMKTESELEKMIQQLTELNSQSKVLIKVCKARDARVLDDEGRVLLSLDKELFNESE